MKIFQKNNIKFSFKLSVEGVNIKQNEIFICSEILIYHSKLTFQLNKYPLISDVSEHLSTLACCTWEFYPCLQLRLQAHKKGPVLCFSHSFSGLGLPCSLCFNSTHWRLFSVPELIYTKWISCLSQAFWINIIAKVLPSVCLLQMQIPALCPEFALSFCTAISHLLLRYLLLAATDRDNIVSLRLWEWCYDNKLTDGNSFLGKF